MSLTPRLIGLAGVIARHGGRAATVALANELREWMADPANEPQRARMTAALKELGSRAGQGAAVVADRVASGSERRKLRVADWEQELLRRRYAIVDSAPGPARAAALADYAWQASRAGEVVAVAADPVDTRRRASRALDAEERMLQGERRMPAADREAALGAVDLARGMIRRSG